MGVVRDNAAQTLGPSLEFLGFHAGARLAELDTRLRELGGSRLRCGRAKADRRVQDCRGVFSDPAFGGSIHLWVSSVDSMAGVLTLSGPVSPDQLDAWRNDLETRYGRVGAAVQGPQWMMQWVRRGRMIRYTWRVENGAKVASISLVDGHILDNWRRDTTTSSP